MQICKPVIRDDVITKTMPNLQLFETKPIIDHLKSFDKSHAKM